MRHIINPTEMVASLINQKPTIVEGILLYAQEVIRGSMTMLIMTPKGIYASRDRWGRTPAVVGKKLTGSGYCVCFESFSFLNLGYMPEKELGAGEIDFLITPEGYEGARSSQKGYAHLYFPVDLLRIPGIQL